MKKLFTLLLAVAASVGTMFAEPVQIGGLYYNLDATSQTAQVTSQNSSYPYWSATITTANIPSSVEYNSVTYTVISIGDRAFWGCSGLTSVTIPNSVTSIGNYAFRDCSGLTSVTIPNSVTSIGNDAFYNCSGLTSVTIPNSVTSIGYRAFYGCSGLTSLVYNAHVFAYMPTSYSGAYTIPDGIESIAGGAFYGCKGLTSVTIPNSVTSIGDRAFHGCSGLTSPVYNAHVFAFMPTSYSGAYTIPDGIESIAGGAFWGCSGLTSVTIPNSVTSIGNDAFYGCKGLTSVTIPNSVTSIGNDAFHNCSGLTSVTIPNSVISIGDRAFWGCSGLTSVTIPNSVTSIGNYAFYYCAGLTSVTIPNSVTSIGDYAFYRCTGLTSVTIPNSVTSIGNSAFSGCTGLTSVTIPNSATSIGSRTFDGCTGLTSITNYATTPQTINANVFDYVNKSTCTLYVPTQSLAAYQAADVWKEFGNILPIEESEEVEVLSIAEAIQIGMALDSMATSAETYTIEGYVINAGTFYAGAKYQNWYMADDQETASSDFQAYRCYPIDGIDTVEVRNGSKVRMTGHLQKYYDRQKALYVVEMTYTPAIILSKPQIDTITVAEALALGAELEDNASSTSKQYAIRGYVSSFSPYYEQLGAQNFYIADDPNSTANTNAAGGFYVYRGVPSTGTAVNKGDLVELTCAIRKYVPASGTNINIENSEFPVSVTVLQAASDPCITASGTCGAQGDNLTWTLTCDSVLTISGTGEMANYEWNGAPWYTNSGSIKSVVIEYGVTSIGDNAFYASRLISVSIPNSVANIGIYAFAHCSSLTSVTFPNSITNIEISAFANCAGLTSITIPNSVTSIGRYAFSKCHGLTSIAIPYSVTSIGNGAFAACANMTSINVDTNNPEYCSVEGILFSKDTTTIRQYPAGKQGAYTIPPSVTNIGKNAFDGCSGLVSVIIPNSVTNIDSYAFRSCSSLTSIEIPNSVKSIGTMAFYSCDNLTTITNYALQPQTINANVFEGVEISTCTLYVPTESIALYQAADVWKEFFNIIGLDDGDEEESNIRYIDPSNNELGSETVSLHLPDVPEIEGFTFLKWQVVAGDLEEGIIIQAVYQADESTSASSVYTNPANPAQKLIRNGNVYILSNEKTYSITGAEVK